MSGFVHYWLSTLDPLSNAGFSLAFPKLMITPLPHWWLLAVLPFVFMVFPSVAVWIVYVMKPSSIRPPLPAVPDQALPFVSVVIAGRNESETIGECIRAALLCGYPNLEVVFVDDNSEDNTVAVARRAALTATGSGRDGNRVRIFPSPRRNGKPSSLNIGIRMARGEFIIIIDADTILAYGSVQHWLVPFRDPKVGAVAANIRVNNSAKCLLTRFQEIEYALKTSNKVFQARFNLLYIISGMGGMFRAEILRRLGGYDTGLGDDRDLTTMIRKQRWKLALSVDAVVWTTCPETVNHLAKQRARWRRNVVKICISKHRDLYVPGRYGLANFMVAIEVLARIIIPLAVAAALFWTIFESGPLGAPEIISSIYWITILYLFMKMMIARDISNSPVLKNFLLAFLFPFYMLFIVQASQIYAEITELFRIGSKHYYVPDHIWEEIPWW